jgi:hypothetical protein
MEDTEGTACSSPPPAVAPTLALAPVLLLLLPALSVPASPVVRMPSLLMLVAVADVHADCPNPEGTAGLLAWRVCWEGLSGGRPLSTALLLVLRVWCIEFALTSSTPPDAGEVMLSAGANPGSAALSEKLCRLVEGAGSDCKADVACAET